MKFLYSLIIIIFSLTLGLCAASQNSNLINSLLDSAEKAYKNIDSSAIYYATKALRISQENNDSPNTANSLMVLGKTLRIFGAYQKAVENLNKSLDLYEDLNNTEKYADNQVELGETYRASANRKQALASINLGLEKFELLNNSYGIAKAANRFAAVYFEIYFNRRNDGRKDTIEIADSINKYLSLSLNIATKRNDFDLLISNYNILGSFFEMKFNSDSALYYLNIAKSLCEEKKKYYELPIILYNISRVHDRKLEFQTAIKYAKLSLDIARKYNIMIYLKLDYQLLSNIYKNLDDNRSALIYLDSVQRVQLDLFTNNVNVKAYLLAVNFENEKNKIGIANEKTKLLLLSLIACLIFVIFLIIIIFYHNKNKLQRKSFKELSDLNNLISEQKKELEESNRTKDKFFSIIAHDLKNPLNGFQNVSDLLCNEYDELSAIEQKELLHLMKDSSKQLNNLLENLLIWSRSQRGVIVFEPVEVNLNYLVNDSLSLLKTRILEKKINIRVDIPENINPYADVNMLNTILRNLISNSVKFTPDSGTITVSAAGNMNDYVIKISDTGVGIPPENIYHLFSIDVNISTPGTNNEKGTGLGLIICKEFINKHGGNISVTSEVGKGTEFRITIPKKS